MYRCRLAAHDILALSAGFGSAYTRGYPMSCTSGAHDLIVETDFEFLWVALSS